MLVKCFQIKMVLHESDTRDFEVDLILCGPGGVAVSALDFKSEGRWFKAQSLPSCCFLRQETLPDFVCLLHPIRGE